MVTPGSDIVSITRFTTCGPRSLYYSPTGPYQSTRTHTGRKKGRVSLRGNGAERSSLWPCATRRFGGRDVRGNVLYAEGLQGRHSADLPSHAAPKPQTTLVQTLWQKDAACSATAGTHKTKNAKRDSDQKPHCLPPSEAVFLQQAPQGVQISHVGRIVQPHVVLLEGFVAELLLEPFLQVLAW